ncbi:hypothetical protein SFC43_01325 [Bacteroides sp. CR5/BHMF/2]|nr:hypothetical protein [Bacteroides sp. CR5/BHMF/2]
MAIKKAKEQKENAVFEYCKSKVLKLENGTFTIIRASPSMAKCTK